MVGRSPENQKPVFWVPDPSLAIIHEKMHAYVTDVTTSKKLMQKLHIMTNNKFVNNYIILLLTYRNCPPPILKAPKRKK